MKIPLINPRYKINGNSNVDFGGIYTSLWSKMLNTVCRKYTTDLDKAEEYCQSGFIKVYDNISKYDGKGSLEAWVSRVINNHIIDELRKSEVEIYDGGDDGFDFSRLIYSEDIYEESEYSISEIMELLKYLSPSYKRVFEMYYLDGLKHNEISEILSISTNTSKTNLMKAKKNLRNYLQNGVPPTKKNKYRV